ncbi:MAG: peptidoglycan DD-metalloendopeptidase family protein [Bacteroidales bacterium]|nr:peptidoglycan DD-metalloendopeptidase family protein [Bacteroidales bacterium]
MKRLIITAVFGLIFIQVCGQTRAELEKQREQAIKDIKYLDTMLKRTEKEKTETIGDLSLLRSKLKLRENVIRGYKEEQALLEKRMELNRIAVEMMEEDIEILIKEYEKAILHAQKESKGNPEIAYILASKDLNQGYKRLKYLQQVAKYRRREAEIILDLKGEVEDNRRKLEEDLLRVSELKTREEGQKIQLQREQRKQRGVITELKQKERTLRENLRKKQRIAEEIEREIERVIEEERRKREMSDMTPEMAIIGDDFAKNKGRLPWPVERGVVTSQFGVHQHPVIKGTEINNIGIEISSGTREAARAVFKGSVMSVFGISGGNMAVIIRHGTYLTVYQNLVNVKVKPGDEVDTKQYIGDVYFDSEGNSKSTIKFMIYEEKDKKNPEQWLSKRR